jgi:hypothetical protein
MSRTRRTIIESKNKGTADNSETTSILPEPTIQSKPQQGRASILVKTNATSNSNGGSTTQSNNPDSSNSVASSDNQTPPKARSSILVKNTHADTPRNIQSKAPAFSSGVSTTLQPNPPSNPPPSHTRQSMLNKNGLAEKLQIKTDLIVKKRIEEDAEDQGGEDFEGDDQNVDSTAQSLTRTAVERFTVNVIQIGLFNAIKLCSANESLNA